MTQSIAIMVLGSPYSQGSSQTALRFCQASLQAGKRIERLFFYHEAAYLAGELNISAQDEQNLPQQWQQFISDNQLDAVVCIASALKRGIINEEEAKRYQKTQHNLSPSISIGGLGLWVEAVNNADRHIVFGA